MTDNLTPEDRRRTMQAVKGSGTKLERRLFSMLAGTGLKGWKKNARSVVGNPDVAFGEQKVAIFIDGCFWHGCPICQRPLPRTNRAYWKRKIQRNVERAKLHNRQLRAAGWIVIRIWEHEIDNRRAMDRIKSKILNALHRPNFP